MSTIMRFVPQQNKNGAAIHVKSSSQVLDLLEALLIYVFDGLKSRYSLELEAVRAQYPFEDLVYTVPSPRITYKEAIAMLREDGVEIDDFADLRCCPFARRLSFNFSYVHVYSTSQEKHLGQLVKKKYGVDFYILDKFPIAVRPFYTMPNHDDPVHTQSLAVLKFEQ